VSLSLRLPSGPCGSTSTAARQASSDHDTLSAPTWITRTPQRRPGRPLPPLSTRSMRCTQERDIIEKQTSAPNLTVGYFSLFRYANGMDRLVMVGALVASIAAGAVMPLMTLVYGNFAGSFTSHSVGAVEAAKFQSQINQFTLYFIYLGTRYILMLLMSTNPHRYRILYNIIHQHHRLLLYRRTYHTTDSRALPPGYL
jgi:hypothetical protein